MSDISNRDICRLCGTPLVGRAQTRGRFCCSGCERVYDVLSRLDESAKAAYLETARKLGLIPKSDVSPVEIPNPMGCPDPAALRDERFSISGMVCPSCAWVVEQILLSNDGVDTAEVDYFSGTAKVGLDLRRSHKAALEEILAPLGYGLESTIEAGREKRVNLTTVYFIIAAVLTVNLMSLSFLRYAEGLGLMDKAPEFLKWLEMLLALPILYIGWVPMVRRAVAALGARIMTMDLLLGIAVLAAFVLSTSALLMGRDDIYFETCAGLVTIALLSQMIEAGIRKRAFLDLAPLLSMPVVRVRKINSAGEEIYCDVDDVKKGERIRFLPGETVPFDGTVRGESAFLSEAVLKGEPTPKRKVAGDKVVAGSSVVEGHLDIDVSRRFKETELSEIANSVSIALTRAENRLRSADRITTWFVPTVLTIAVGIWLFRLIAFGLDVALSPDGWFPSVAVLAVACPCAFSLAGVSAITGATGVLLRLGILVKESSQLEKLPTINHVIFDKTGTVTLGQMQVDCLVWRENEDQAALSTVLAAENGSAHPVAQAIRCYLHSMNITEPDKGTKSVTDLPGQGRKLKVENRVFSVGSAALFDDLFEPNEMTARHSGVWFGFNGRALGCFMLTDTIRAEAKETLKRLQHLGLTAELLSGDRQSVTTNVAKEIGIKHAKGDATIGGKVELVNRHTQSGRAVAFVGDGTNDAMAMGESAVSIALAKGTDEALSASGFVALNGNLSTLPKLFEVGRKLARVIRSNYIWAFVFNTVFIPVAALGYLTPLAAMLLMLMSSTAVLLNSLRLKS